MTGNTLAVEMENVGGITHVESELEAGVSFVQGPNATNKSSFLKGLLFALGAETVPIRSGSTEARVVLESGERRIERVARRTDTGIETAGEAWIEDPDEVALLECFAALLETNPLRTAVLTQNAEVGSLLKEPMDIEALKASRAEKLERKRELTEAIESSANVADRLEERGREIEAKRERIESLEAELEALYEEQEDTAEDEVLEKLQAERAEAKSEQAACQTQIEQLEAAIERLEDERRNISETLEDKREAIEDADVVSLKRQRESIRTELADVTERLEVLQNILTANREMLNSDHTGVLGYDSGLMADEISCWACGQTGTVDQFEEMTEHLAELVERDKRNKREHEPKIEELSDRIESVRTLESDVQRLESERASVVEKLEQRRNSLEEQREQLEDAQDRIEDLDERIANREAEQLSSQSDVTSEIERTRVEIQTTRREIERLEEQCESLREAQNERQRQQASVDALTEEIAALTDRIENFEAELRSVFNDSMDDLLDELSFERIERVWLDGDFNLVIARDVDGQIQRDAPNQLAESEREMIGLVLALAGFIVYDVGETVPALVLDSLGSFDEERTVRLVRYFAEKTDYLIATAHPETDVTESFDTIRFDQLARQ